MSSKYVFYESFEGMSVARAVGILERWNKNEEYEAWLDGDEQALVVVDKTHAIPKDKKAAREAIDAAMNVVRNDWT
jgi:hypothetical protein